MRLDELWSALCATPTNEVSYSSITPQFVGGLWYPGHEFEIDRQTFANHASSDMTYNRTDDSNALNFEGSQQCKTLL